MTANLWVFAGPNGAGKSTLVTRLVRGRLTVVNPDDLGNRVLVSGFSDGGRKAMILRGQLLSAGRSFGIETTLSGHSEQRLVIRAKAAGFRVSLIYIGLDNVQLSIARVFARVARGGHDVPIPDLLRRFDRSIAGLKFLARLADRLVLIDNSSRSPKLIYWNDPSGMRRRATELPDWAAGVLDNLDIG